MYSGETTFTEIACQQVESIAGPFGNLFWTGYSSEQLRINNGIQFLYSPFPYRTKATSKHFKY